MDQLTPDVRTIQGGGNVAEVFRAFLGLGLTSFGGPVAHLGYFREAFVVRRKWIGEQAYADLVALCQFLPGPASSQVGMAIGLQRAGYVGLLAAWTAFTLPSAILLVAFAYGASALGADGGTGWIQGLKAAAVAVVAHAVLGMARNLTPDRERATIAVIGMILAMTVPTALGQVAVIVLGGAIGAGSLVFGGGHVVLPLLEAEVVETGFVGREEFLAGYGAAQAVPGPLFTFAAYLGAVHSGEPSGLYGAAVALIAIFVPSALLIMGGLPYWDVLRKAPLARRALMGVNAAVVGLLAAALYDPVFTESITSPVAMAIAAAAFVALAAWNAPAWAVVVAAGLAGFLVL
ncbi:chromate transporter [Mesorhizobium sp.]|uniref:chromate transporter n=1 Tax=Mesorhizobium sp. TaxID=1871066 RepID=UPI000FE744A8|nr:chromate transporter [Mesorhizobium sp.]RWK56934.1 MAG: chromate transporter [Mesorhizobium sp.]TIP44643.1 MAG: chromate transporter [Mesorhizobium sp.]